MKVQLVVVQGKPEGKMIPLVGPRFKIGRGEGCHLRPNSDQVSREHAEFEVGASGVTVRDLGSRNGTDVNGKPLAKDQVYTLKNGDLVKVGSLTFAVSIEGAPAAKSAPAAPGKKSLDDVGHDEIGAWLVSDAASPTPDRPSGVYGGDTITIDSYQELQDKTKAPAAKAPAAKAPTPAPAPAPAAKAPAPPPKPAPAAKPAPVAKAPEPEPEPEPEATPEHEEFEQYVPDDDEGIEDLAKAQESEIEEDFMDESNPFYKKKEAAQAPKSAGPGGAVKPSQKDSSDVAGDILRKMMDRRRASKS